MTDKNFSRTLSRLAAVQILYALDSKDELASQELDIEGLIRDSSKYHQKEQTSEIINTKFLKRLITLVLQNLQEIDSKIISNLKESNDWTKMNLLLKAILRNGICEILYFKTPVKVSIDEYVKLTKKFFDDDEIGFVNALLDKVGKGTV
jgi:N utilization substance protein B